MNDHNGIARRHNLDPETFRNDFLRAGRPVILTGLAEESPACRKWSFDFFAGTYGHETLAYQSESGATKRAPLAEVIGLVQAGRGVYLRNWKFMNVHPELWDDLPAPPHFAEDWLQHLPQTRNFLREIFIGGPGTSTPFHVDIWESHFWVLMVAGCKEWTMLSPQDYKAIRDQPPRGNQTEQEKTEALLAAAPHFRFELKPGELLFVPGGWGHGVRNLKASISASVNLVDAECFAAGWRWTHRSTDLLERLLFAEIKKRGDREDADFAAMLDGIGREMEERSQIFRQAARRFRRQGDVSLEETVRAG